MSDKHEGRTPAPEPGIYDGVPFAEYLRWDACSQSLLKVLRDRSPYHVQEAIKNPSEPTAAKIKGAATHMAVFEPERFAERYARGIDGDGRTKVVKDAKARLAAERPYATILPAKDFDEAIGVMSAVRTHPGARIYLAEGGLFERSCVFFDPETGIKCKMRIDAYPSREMAVIADLKTTVDAGANAFAGQLFMLRYYWQSWFYLRGAAELDLPAEDFVFVAAESSAPSPHKVACYRLRQGEITQAGYEMEPLIRRYAECQQKGEWPGYSLAADEDIGLLPWHWKRVEAAEPERIGSMFA